MRKLVIFCARLLMLVSFGISWLQLKVRQLFKMAATEKDVDAFIRYNRISTSLTPYGLSYTILQSFHWKEDMLGGLFDFAKHPYVFLYDKEDDCDGFACFCEYICNKVGFKNVSVVYVVDVLSMKGHAVAIVEFPKYGYTICGNWPFVTIMDNTLATIATTVGKEMLENSDNPLLCIRYAQNRFIEGDIISQEKSSPLEE